MIYKRVLEILNLPKTVVIGRIKRVYNPYTLFLPFNAETDFDYVLVTHLTEYSKNRIKLRVPFTAEEEFLCRCLDNKKKVFSLHKYAIDGMSIIPDDTTRVITKNLLDNYPFGTVLVPENAIITPSAKDENIIIKEFKICKSEEFLKVFGQPKKTSN
ncbi:MAG: hypothetical protein IKJ06_04635 [Clostridia bacterium]|nr:hypothetical protein [Clostridia bacterium]